MSESKNLVLETSYLLTQIARFLVELFIHFQISELYMNVSKPPDITLKRTRYITYIVNTVISITHPSSFTSGWILTDPFPVAGVLDFSCCVTATCSCRSGTVGLAAWLVRKYIRFCEVSDLCTSSSSLSFILWYRTLSPSMEELGWAMPHSVFFSLVVLEAG